jgi:radical SAM superfamily enzyme YgiQ (UPF0313 family)
MNVLFISPLNESFDVLISAPDTPWKSKLTPSGDLKKIDVTTPNGLLSMASYLDSRVEDVCVKIMDLNVFLIKLSEEIRARQDGKTIRAFTREQFLDHVFFVEFVDFKPDIIGISAPFCSTMPDLEPLAFFLKNLYKDAVIVGGGHMLSAIYGDVFEKASSFDAICFGEGEIPFTELARSFENGNLHDYIASSGSWITRRKLLEHPDFMPENSLIFDLDEIPPYRFDLLVHDIESFLRSGDYFFITEKIKTRKDCCMFTTRGCPHNCIFCASQNIHGHKVRKYSAERIKKDIIYYNERYGINCFLFYDDNFLHYKDRAVEILNFVASCKLECQIPTPAFFKIDDDISCVMHAAGVTETMVTIDSGNEETLKKIINKPGGLREAKSAIISLRNAGIVVITNLLFGMPGETKEAMEKGIRNMFDVGSNWYQCFVTAPLPGSRMYNICKENGYFIDNINIFDMDFKRCVINTPDFDPKYVEEKVYEANLLLNFVENFDTRHDEYRIPLMLYERIINDVLPTHAFAYYYAALCSKKLKLHKKAVLYTQKYYEMHDLYPFWQKWVNYFDLKAI